MIKKFLAVLILLFVTVGLCGCTLVPFVGRKVTNVPEKVITDNGDSGDVEFPEVDSDDEVNTPEIPEDDIEEDVEEDVEEDNDPVIDDMEDSEDKQGNLLDSMSYDEKYEVNIFLSNFSEALYGLGGCNDVEDKLSFAYNHCRVNNRNADLYSGNGKYGINSSDVDTVLKRFFGKTIPHTTPAGADMWTYENGYFVFPAADGESHAYFSIATDMKSNGNGTYTVAFNTYFNSNGPHDPIDSSWYGYSDVEAGQYFEFSYDGTAVIRPKTYNGSKTYEIISYQTSIA